jgi:hypothetical protein
MECAVSLKADLSDKDSPSCTGHSPGFVTPGHSDLLMMNAVVGQLWRSNEQGRRDVMNVVKKRSPTGDPAVSMVVGSCSLVRRQACVVLNGAEVVVLHHMTVECCTWGVGEEHVSGLALDPPVAC